MIRKFVRRRKGSKSNDSEEERYEKSLLNYFDRQMALHHQNTKKNSVIAAPPGFSYTAFTCIILVVYENPGGAAITLFFLGF